MEEDQPLWYLMKLSPVIHLITARMNQCGDVHEVCLLLSVSMNRTVIPLTVEAMDSVLQERVIVLVTGLEVPVMSFSVALQTVVVMGNAPRLDVNVTLAGQAVTAVMRAFRVTMEMDVPASVCVRTMGHVTTFMGTVRVQLDFLGPTVKKCALLVFMVYSAKKFAIAKSSVTVTMLLEAAILLMGLYRKNYL